MGVAPPPVGERWLVRLTGATRIAVETEEGLDFTVSSALFKLKLLLSAYELLVVHEPGRIASMRTHNTGGCTMNKVLVGVVSAADFERARDYISELLNFRDYEDWLDSRYGHFMGLSMGGAEASLETASGLPHSAFFHGGRPTEHTFRAS